MKVQNGALQSLADMTQTGLHTIQGSLCQIQGYLRLHRILHTQRPATHIVLLDGTASTDYLVFVNINIVKVPTRLTPAPE